MKKRRIPKTSEQRLDECETHLYFLWDAHRLYPQQKDRYKQIASELRVLVGDHRPRRRLLLALMEDYGFSYAVQPPGPPFDKQPISMVGWRDDPHHQALTKEIEQAMGDKEKLDELLEKQAAMRRPVPFPEYVDRAQAVYIAPHDYSYRDLVLAVAQQVGSSHEDTAVDETLVQLGQFVIGRNEGHIAPLIGFADLVIEVGSRFIAFVSEKHGYNPKYFKPAG